MHDTVPRETGQTFSVPLPEASQELAALDESEKVREDERQEAVRERVERVREVNKERSARAA